jgi:hypothetical protein
VHYCESARTLTLAAARAAAVVGLIMLVVVFGTGLPLACVFVWRRSIPPISARNPALVLAPL